MVVVKNATAYTYDWYGHLAGDSLIMLSVIVKSIIVLSAVMINMLSVVMLSVIMLIVVMHAECCFMCCRSAKSIAFHHAECHNA